MTTFSKCLAVLALVASLAFLGIVSVSAVGGPNFEAQLDDPEFSAYVFNKEEDSEGKVTYSVETKKKRLQDPNNPASAFEIQKVSSGNAKVLPQVMIDTLNAEMRHQQARIALLDKRLANLKQTLAAVKAATAADYKAVQARISALNDAIAAEAKKLSDLNKKVATTQDETRKKAVEAVRRLQEIKRLKNQVEILKADKVRLDQQQTKLEILIKQMQGEVNAAKERNEQLKKQIGNYGGTSGGNAKPKAAATSLSNE